AVYWGWIPAFLWVILGTVFAAGVHDFGTLVLSVRNKGHSVGTIADKLVGQRAKMLFLFIILILVLMVNAVFAWVIANLFISFPACILPLFFQLSLLIYNGFAVYKRKKKMPVSTLLSLSVKAISAIMMSIINFLQIG